MSKEIYISSTPHETRLAIVESDALTEIYYERENEYTLAGSIYNGKVTRVLPGMQSSFVDIGLDRDAFLYITDFMEEAGDTTDFEANAQGGDLRRAPRETGRSEGERSDNRRSGNDRGVRAPREARPDRNVQPRLGAPEPSTHEPTDSELFTEAVSGLDPARPVSNSERSNNRRGGRNGRGRNSDVTPPREERGADRSSSNRVEMPQAEFSSMEIAPSILSVPPSVENLAEAGEGAPGADGSRRWRGRRGRRGSRPEAPQDIVVQPQVPASKSNGPVYNPYPVEDAFEVSETPLASQAVTNDRSPREQNSDRGERGSRGNRGDRAPQTPRVPRGFAPSTSLYQVDGAAESVPYGQDSYAPEPAEPVILPGESLGKYRAANNEATASPAFSSTSPAAPVPEFIAAGWDGGMVLPGETIRPRGPRPDTAFTAEPRREPSVRDDRDGRGGRADDRGGRGGRDSRGGDRNRSGPGERRGSRQEMRAVNEENRSAATATPPAQEIAQHTSEVPQIHASTYRSNSEDVAASQITNSIDSTFVPPPPVPTEVNQPTPAVAASVAPAPMEHEYEPTKASVSYRVEPASPSEFRQSPSILEEELVESQPVTELKTQMEAAPDPSHDVEPTGHTHMAVNAAAPLPDHQLTSISAVGEMYTEPSKLTTQELTAAAPSAFEIPSSTEPRAADIAAGDQTLPYFAPGTGLLEEEMLDDEEEAEPARVGAMQAHAEDEEDTLESAADLGTIIREMSIDRTTRNEPVMDDENDDNFLEEDQDFEDSNTEEEDGNGGPELDSRAAERNVSEQEDAAGSELAQSPYGNAFELEPSESEFSQSQGGDRAILPNDTNEPRRDGRSGDRGRREGRRGDRNRRSGSGERERGSSSSSSDHDRNRDRGRGRQSMQSTNLPAISDLLKPGQEVLVQIAKEPIAKKGARITSHIALPGRFLVFMPTVHHTGVSRKIESDAERRRLKEILLSEKGEAAGGFIVRTAASGASEEELRSDLRFLLNLWSDIKARSEGSKSPALIYHDLNLVERVLRDQVTDTFSAIWVDTEVEYERVLRFLQRFQPSLIRRVKLYTKETPLFEQFGITEEINKALRSKVWLKSGGSIVINQTEALVAIDINTGKFVGKTARLEDTIVKTNLDAIPEIVRQIRLRDLGGIIIIDFIDMDDRKNRNKVMAALEDELKSDRAPSKVLQFNDFGLVAITRKRVKQSLERTLSTTCGVCQGTGMVKSPVTVCNDIYIEIRKMHKHMERGDIMLRVHPDVVKQLKSTTSRWLQEMEEIVGRTILIKSDPSLHPEQFDLH